MFIFLLTVIICNCTIYYLWNDWKYVEGEGYGKDGVEKSKLLPTKKFSKFIITDF